MKHRHFDMTLTYDGHAVRVTGRVTPGQPATGPTYDCGGTPPEPSEIEDFLVFDEAGHEIEDADGEILEALEDEIIEHVSQDVADDMNDAAEYRHDAERDA